MIPNANNINNYNNQIKIQLTNDNKCIIQALSESPIKSQNTIIKEDFSINEDMSLSKSNSMINNNSHNATKQIISNSNTKNNNYNFDLENNSNLLISFSNISEVAKVNNNDASMTRINSNKNNSILMNKEKDFISNINNAEVAGNSFLSNQMQITTGDKNVTINNINNFNIANSDGKSIISNHNFFISNEKNNKVNLKIDNNENDENTDTIKTPNKNNSRNNKNETSNKKDINNNDTKSINKQLINSFNKNDLSEISGIINLNIDDKSENYDKVNMVYSDRKSFNTSNNLNSTTSINIASNNISPRPTNKNSSNNKSNNIKFFKNCIVQKNENINIIQINSRNDKSKNNSSNKTNIDNNKINNNINNKIVPKHCANFSFSGISQKNNNLKELVINNCLNKGNEDVNLILNGNNSKNNNLDKNDDYVSPTFNLNLNFNSLDKNNNTLESLKIKENIKNENLNKNDQKVIDNNFINNNTENNINILRKEKNLSGPQENSNGSTIEITDKNKKDLGKKNSDNQSHNTNNNVHKNTKIQEKNLSLMIHSNMPSKSNANTKIMKEKALINYNLQIANSQKTTDNNSNNVNNQIKNKKNGIASNNQNKNSMTNKNKEENQNNNLNNIININKNININNNLNNINTQNEKCNHIIVNKKNQNSRYTRHPNVDSANICNNNLKNLYSSLAESERNNKKLSISHNKSKSGTGSIIKFPVHDVNIFNVKSGNLIKMGNNYNFKKFKSISPTIQRRNCNNLGIKEKSKKCKSQSKSKSKNRSHFNKNDINELNYFIMNGKYNNNTGKQKSFKEKMESILSKNIIALTRKKRKSPSPKIRISRPSLIKNIISKNQKNLVDNKIYTNNFGNNIYHNGAPGKKTKNSPSPVSFRISNNNTNIIYGTNSNNSNKKSILYLNNNCQNMDNLLLINNSKNSGARKKIVGNSPKLLMNQNSSEQYENSAKRVINNQNASSNKKQNLPFKYRSSYGTGVNNINNNVNKNIKIQNKKIKNSVNINRKNINIYKYDDDYNSLNERKKSFNSNVMQVNKRISNSKNNMIYNMIHNNKNIILSDINKKNTLIINNQKVVTTTIKKQMTIIQNFSKYKKKGAINTINNNYVKNNCYNENISNNYCQINDIRKIKNLKINNIANRTIDEKRKKNEYTHSQPKMTDNANNCYTN